VDYATNQVDRQFKSIYSAWFSQETIFRPKNPSDASRFCGFKSNLCHGNIKIEIHQAFLRKPSSIPSWLFQGRDQGVVSHENASER
jgi:hypothetical protein